MERTALPLFVSRRRLARRKRLPVAACRWALDSGGFTELSMFGEWQTSPGRYADEAESYRTRIGRLAWAAVQDWMCEPLILEKTGKTVKEHQALTIASVFALRGMAPDVPWAPVLQGWDIDDYHRHADQYEVAGIDLRREAIVGVGSVCQRQGTRFASVLFRELAERGMRLHGFGLKTLGLPQCSRWLASSDSMAWSLRARRSEPLPGCTHQSCSNCLKFALRWREQVVQLAARPQQR